MKRSIVQTLIVNRSIVNIINLLSPYWPLLLALVLPLLIHFWNKQKATRIQFGSIRYLEEVKKNHWYRIRLSDFPLLLLRLLLFTLLAFLLMQPVWQQLQQPQAQTRLYLSPDLLPAKQYSIIQALVDSIPKEQLQLQLLYPGFPSIENADTSLQLAVNQHINYWQLLQSVATQIEDARDLTCYAFATDLLKNYQGQKPYLSGKVNLYQLPIKTERKWLAKVDWLNEQEVLLTVGKSTSEQSIYSKQVIKLNSDHQTIAIPDWGSLTCKATSPRSWRLKAPNNTLVDTILTAPKQFLNAQVTVFYAPNRQEDLRYVKAALTAIDKVYDLPYSIQTRSTKQLAKHKDNSQFYIWLSPDTLPTVLIERAKVGAIILADARGDSFTQSNQLIIRKTGNSDAPPRLLEASTQAPSNGEAIWQDGSGAAILSRQAVEQGWRYDFVGRFVPSSTSMVNDGILADWLYDWLLQQDHIQAQQFSSHDIRSDFVSQIKPIQKVTTPITNKVQAPLIVHQKLHFFWWLLVVILFIFERGWAAYKHS